MFDWREILFAVFAWVPIDKSWRISITDNLFALPNNNRIDCLVACNSRASFPQLIFNSSRDPSENGEKNIRNWITDCSYILRGLSQCINSYIRRNVIEINFKLIYKRNTCRLISRLLFSSLAFQSNHAFLAKGFMYYANRAFLLALWNFNNNLFIQMLLSVVYGFEMACNCNASQAERSIKLRCLSCINGTISYSKQLVSLITQSVLALFWSFAKYLFSILLTERFRLQCFKSRNG